MEHELSQVQHLTTEELLDYSERRLSPDEASLVEAHLATDCQQCQADLLWYQQHLELMVSNKWLDPPPHLRAAARRIFREQQQKKSSFGLGEWLSSLKLQPRSFAMAGATMLILVIISGILLWTSQSSSSGAEFSAMKGAVAVQPAGSDIWVPATEEVELEDGSTVRTGTESSVVLTFPDDSKVVVAPDTELSILRMSAREDGSTRVIILRQDSGSTHNVVQESSSPASRYEIQTPSATVLVMGTEFTVIVDDVGSTQVMVSSGTVAVAAQGSTIALEAGQTTTVNPGDEPATVQGSPSLPSGPEITRTENNEENELEDEEIQELLASETPVTPSPTGTPVYTPSPIAVTPTSATGEGIQPPAQPTNTAQPINTAQPTNTPAAPQPLPTETEVTAPTAAPTETPKTKKTPPGQTKTPQPPGRSLSQSSDKTK